MSGLPGDPPAHAGFDRPFRIDWIPVEALRDGLPGRLGLTHLPGKRGPSARYPGHVYRRVLADDLAQLRAGSTSLLVLLVEDSELERWGNLGIAGAAEVAQVPVLRVPIRDGSAPASPEVMDGILDALSRARAAGDAVVACMGGVGRSGTVAACALVAAGHEAQAAIRLVRAIRHPEAVESAAQEQFVVDYAVRGRPRALQEG